MLLAIWPAPNRADHKHNQAGASHRKGAAELRLPAGLCRQGAVQSPAWGLSSRLHTRPGTSAWLAKELGSSDGRAQLRSPATQTVWKAAGKGDKSSSAQQCAL